MQEEAYEAYARRDFKRAVDKLSELIYQQPQSARWSEMRAQVLLDSKNFAAAIMDYNEAMQRTPGLPLWLHPAWNSRAQQQRQYIVLINSTGFQRHIKHSSHTYAGNQSVNQARLLAGRGLALEGEESWHQAISDYQQALSLASEAGYFLSSAHNI